MFAAGHQAGLEGTFERAHTGVLQGADGSQIPPTSRHVSFYYAEFYTVSDDQIVTLHLYLDQMELLTQLGLTPEPATS